MNKARNSNLQRAFCIIVVLILSACAPAATPEPTSTVAPTATATSVPTSTPVPTATNTPEPTPLPGVQVFPLTSLDDRIPWLPSDKENNPMSVYYGFNTQKPPFNYVLVRQAFAAAVDREQIAQKALEYNFRDAAPATTLTPPEILGRDLYNQVGIPFDPARGRELLVQAGYSDPKSFPVTTLLISVRGRGAPGAYYQMAKMVVDMWKTNLGVEVVIDTATIPDYPSRFGSNPPGIYQLGWGADYNDPDNFLKALFRSDREINYGHFNNKEFDRLVDEATSWMDPEKRLLLYIQAERILSEQEAALIPLYHSYVPIPYVY